MTYRLKKLIPLPLESLCPPAEFFTHQSRIHGQAHVARVMVHAFLLVDALGLEELSSSVWGAVYFHDIAREHDGVCLHHGQYAVEKADTLPHVKALLAKGGVASEDWEVIAVAVENHCREEIPRDDPHWTLTAILKDADGLDRVRLGDLDPRYFRFPVTHEFVSFAQALYQETDAKLHPGPDYFATVWPVAQRLLSGMAG